MTGGNLSSLALKQGNLVRPYRIWKMLNSMDKVDAKNCFKVLRKKQEGIVQNWIYDRCQEEVCHVLYHQHLEWFYKRSIGGANLRFIHRT